MATQSGADENNYKREYRRIKSLVSSAYVRQTSVSLAVFETEQLLGRVLNSHMLLIVMSTKWFTQNILHMNSNNQKIYSVEL